MERLPELKGVNEPEIYIGTVLVSFTDRFTWTNWLVCHERN